MGWLSSPQARANLRLISGVVMVTALTSFDIRDLVYKLTWLGPYDTFKFAATGDNFIDANELTLASNWTASWQEIDGASGWSSFAERCPRMFPSGDVFRAVVAENCTVGSTNHPHTVPTLVLASSVRVDSIVWAACRLLRIKRQPTICSEQIARGFLERTFTEAANVPTSWIAKPSSKEEEELLSLLDVVASSSSMNKVTCLEGFPYTEPGNYRSTIVGCGSPDYFVSAFAGYHATNLSSLLGDKAYLTIYDFNLMGFHYKMRQNCISDFVVEITSKGELNVIYTTIINFSTYGQLYALQIVNDVVLMVVNLLSALQIGFSLVAPAFRSRDPHGIENFLREGYSSFLECTLYRSPVVIAMIVISQLLSWLLVIPNSVIWSWGNSNIGKIQAYLTTVRLWTLILVVVNIAWDFFAFLREELAYRIAKYTFLTPMEIIVVGASVSYINRDKIFAIEFSFDLMQSQRHSDASAFKDHIAAYNAYNPELDHDLSTSTEALWLVYRPLFQILLYSLIAVIAYTALKGGFIYWTPFGRNRNRNYLVTAQDAQEQPSTHEQPSAEEQKESEPPSCDVDRQPSARSLGTFVHYPEKYRSFVDESAQHSTARGSYTRLPLEILLNTPIRARSLSRPSLELDHIVNHERFVPTQLYLEFGVFFVEGRMKPRWGFSNPIPPVIQVDNTVISDMIKPLTPEQLMKRLRSAAKVR